MLLKHYCLNSVIVGYVMGEYLRVLTVLIGLAILVNPLITSLTYSAGPSISIYITYDPVENYGALNIQADFTTALNNTVLELPLPGLGNGRYGSISVSAGNGKPLTYSLDEERNLLRILVNESTKTISVDAYIYDVADEVGVDTYVLNLNFTQYTGTSSFHGKLVLMGNYNTTIIPTLSTRKPTVSRAENTTIIDIYEPDNYIIIAAAIPEIPGAPAGGAGGAGGTTKPPASMPGLNPLIISIIIAVIAGAAAASYIFYRRSREPEIISIPPTELLSDETIKEIILYIGDAGPQGIQQSKLVRLTHRPKSTISRRVKRLANEGYVEITRMGKHNIVKLTEKGYEAYKKLKKEVGG